MKKDDSIIRKCLEPEILKAAKEFGITVDASRCICLSTQKFTIVNIPVVLKDMRSLEDLMDGRPLMLMYLELGKKSEIPTGFYTVSAGERPRMGAWKDVHGKEATDGTLVLKYGDIGTQELDVSLNTNSGGVCGDISGSWEGVPFEIKGCLKVKVEVDVDVCIPSCD